MEKELNGYEKAFLPIMQINYENVQYETYGHLAAVKNKKYVGEKRERRTTPVYIRHRNTN